MVLYSIHSFVCSSYRSHYYIYVTIHQSLDAHDFECQVNVRYSTGTNEQYKLN